MCEPTLRVEEVRCSRRYEHGRARHVTCVDQWLSYGSMATSKSITNPQCTANGTGPRRKGVDRDPRSASNGYFFCRPAQLILLRKWPILADIQTIRAALYNLIAELFELP